jgi:carboxypeptidase Q
MTSAKLVAAGLTVVTVVTLSTRVVSQDSNYLQVVAQIRDEGFNRARAIDYAWYLADVIGPRLSGSAALRASQAWAKAEMDAIGLTDTSLEPFGEPGVNWDVEYVSLHLLEPDYQPLIGYPQAFTSGTDGAIQGQVVVADILSRSDLGAYRGQLNDTIVLSTPMREYGPRFEPAAVRHDERSLEVFTEDGGDRNITARREEAWALNPPPLLDLSEEELEEFYRDEGVAAVLVAAQGGDGTLFVTGRRDRSMAAVQNSLPTLLIAAEHYGRMYRLVSRNVPVTMQAEVRITLEARDDPEYNVVGELAGSDLVEEVVMIGAHLDSWHVGTGATDNASGVAVVLEAMRILKAVGATPRRTIRAALWGYEEGGLRGSRAYVAQHFGSPLVGTTDDYERFSGYFNLDNGTGQIRGVHLQGNPAVATIFDEWMQPFHDLNVRTLSTFSNLGSDQLAFDEVGLPGFQFLQDRIEYRTRTHHTNMDVFEKLLPGDLEINAVVLAAFAYQAAQVGQRLPRKPFNLEPPGD